MQTAKRLYPWFISFILLSAIINFQFAYFHAYVPWRIPLSACSVAFSLALEALLVPAPPLETRL